MDIFPTTWNFDIENNVGRESVPMKYKAIQKEVRNKLCKMVNVFILKSAESNIYSTIEAPVFKD